MAKVIPPRPVVSPYMYPGIPATEKMDVNWCCTLFVNKVREFMNCAEQQLFSRSRDTDRVIGRQMIQFFIGLVLGKGLTVTVRYFRELSPYARKNWETLDHSSVNHAINNILMSLCRDVRISKYDKRVYDLYQYLKVELTPYRIQLPEQDELRKILERMKDKRKEYKKKRRS